MSFTRLVQFHLMPSLIDAGLVAEKALFVSPNQSFLPSTQCPPLTPTCSPMT